MLDSYRCPVWGNVGETSRHKLRKLKTVQRRIVTGCRHDQTVLPTYSCPWMAHGWEILDLEALKMVLKSLNIKVPSCMSDMFTRVNKTNLPLTAEF